MFRCEGCETSYAARVASSSGFCPRCLSDREVAVPLTFELGWSSTAEGPTAAHREGSLATMTPTASD
jgi:hypothetical protein